MARLGRVIPHAKTADEGVGIVAGPTSSWQLVHVNDVATTYCVSVFGVIGIQSAFWMPITGPIPTPIDSLTALPGYVRTLGKLSGAGVIAHPGMSQRNSLVKLNACAVG
jgi:hypothetical protein